MVLPCLLRQLRNCPDLFDLAEYKPERYPFLLENSGDTTELGKFDILFAFPGKQLTSHSDGNLELDGKKLGKKSFLDQLNVIYQQHDASKSLSNSHGLPFCGGWFLFLGYELAAEVEPVLSSLLHEPALPRATMTEIPAGIVRNRQTGKDFAFATGDNAEELLELILIDVGFLENNTGNDTAGDQLENSSSICNINEAAEESYIQSVKKIQNYIREGDVFQVNLSRLWFSDCHKELPVSHAWRKLRKTNPAPFAAWVRLDETTTLLSSSPERLLELRNGIVHTRPIAGTYPRSNDQNTDKSLSAELLMHPKERAEHIMLVDLERNDLGRICRPGTILVNELMLLESYAHVHHIVSDVSGELKDGVKPGDIIRAIFPGGTITGCPKVHCMEIIAELETEARDAYTGSVGYLCHNGDMDLNILIRTITHRNDRYSFRAGAGIVADSDPQRELAETRSKARGLYRIFDSNYS